MGEAFAIVCCFTVGFLVLFLGTVPCVVVVCVVVGVAGVVFCVVAVVVSVSLMTRLLSSSSEFEWLVSCGVGVG